jgi:hypothetical protein
MRRLIESDPRNADRIVPYIGGEEVNSAPTHAHHRYVIDFFDRPLRRDSSLEPWSLLSSRQRDACVTSGIVPADYPGEVAEDFPDLVRIVRDRVKPERDVQKRDALRERWWHFAEKRPGLRRAIAGAPHVLAMSRVSPMLAIAKVSGGMIYADTIVIFAYSSLAPFAVLQSRVHELWARFFSSSMKDDLRYAPSDCFRTFPFPSALTKDLALEAAGEAYHTHRAAVMIERNEGLTRTYNRFHARSETAADIEHLRELHATMDQAVLTAYGWNDLAESARPEFIEQEADAGKKPKTQLDWPAAFKDEVLARLLALNAERAAAERAAGLSPAAADDDDLIDEDEAA